MKRFRSLCPWAFAAFDKLEKSASAGRLGHAWLITGPRGVGKASLAYSFADRLLHESAAGGPPEPAGPAEVLADYAELEAYEPPEAPDLHPDLHRVRPEEEKRSISVDQIRAMTGDIVLTPHVARSKLVIIEPAESMTMEAANALLKTLEEPTPNTYIFLLAARLGPLPATIRSRCQHLALKAPAAEDVLEWCRSGGLDPERLPPGAPLDAPVAIARLLSDEEITKEYNQLYKDINSFYEGKTDPHSVAQSWSKGNTDLALGCLIRSLEASIRCRLVSGHRNPITDENLPIAHNPGSGPKTETLFEGRKLAENLREQLGRGINMELAITAMLLDLKEA